MHFSRSVRKAKERVESNSVFSFFAYTTALKEAAVYTSAVSLQVKKDSLVLYPRSVKLLHDEYSFRNKEQPTSLWAAGSSLTQKHNGRRCCFCSVCDGIHRSCRSESHKSHEWTMACSSIGKSFRLITGWFRVRVPAGQPADRRYRFRLSAIKVFPFKRGAIKSTACAPSCKTQWQARLLSVLQLHERYSQLPCFGAQPLSASLRLCYYNIIY